MRELSLYLTQFEIHEGRYISFILPPQVAYGHTVEVLVDYGESQEDAEKLVCNAWLRSPEYIPNIRFFSVSITIPKPVDLQIVGSEIVTALNMSDRFDQELHSFVRTMLNGN